VVFSGIAKAAIPASWQNYHKVKNAKAAKGRQRAAGGAVAAKLPPAEKRKARDDAAKVMGVSPRLVQDAKLVKAKGTPEDVAAVRSAVFLDP